jgi:hypothetical protein
MAGWRASWKTIARIRRRFSFLIKNKQIDLTASDGYGRHGVRSLDR